MGITEVGTDVLAKAGSRFGCPVVFDLHGIGAIEIIELGREYGPRWGRLRDSCRWLSRIPGAAAITVANPTLFTILKPFNKRTIPIIGMTDVSLFRPEGPSVSLGRDQTKLQVLYAGNCFKWQGVELLVEAMKSLLREREPMEFTLLGSARRDERITAAWRASLPEDAVHFREAVDYSQVPAHVRGADILVIPRPFMLSTYL
ncbi:MAG: glycosyltransferase, partial [Deltaproteobacteria bacterium]|nr:glycosyltransferase [Deltaproteobacteria bacterium]